VGRIIGEALQHFRVPLVVVDYDQDNVEQVRSEGLLALYGDAASPLLLEQSGASDARVAVLALPELRDTLLALRHLDRINPEMPKIARGIGFVGLELCYEHGAEEVVYPEVECGLELARYALLRLGFSGEDIRQYVDNVRITRYRCGPPPGNGWAG
jgi:CPA2 family monovalent cation:H+ antiporter-2